MLMEENEEENFGNLKEENNNITSIQMDDNLINNNLNNKKNEKKNEFNKLKEFKLKKIIKENHKSFISFSLKHNLLQNLFLTISNKGKQINIYNNNHCNGHLDLFSHYLHTIELNSNICWINNELILFSDKNGNLFELNVKQSRIERMIDNLSFNNDSNDSNEEEEEDENTLNIVNCISSSFSSINYCFNNENSIIERKEEDKLFVLISLQDGKYLQCWSVPINFCYFTCFMGEEEERRIYFLFCWNINEFIIIRKNNSFEMITINNSDDINNKNVQLSKRKLKMPELLFNGDDEYNNERIRGMKRVKDLNEKNILMILTNKQLIVGQLKNENFTIIQTIYLNEPIENDNNNPFTQFDYFIENDEIIICIAIKTTIYFYQLNIERKELKEMDQMKHKRKGIDLNHILCFKEEDTMLVNNFITLGSNSILRFERK
ncbi:hypothetical protein ABK040_016237 [Willaertia magna]